LKKRPSISSHLSSSKEKRSGVLLIDTDGSSYYTCYLARGLAKFRKVILYSFSEESYSITGADKEKDIEFHYIKKWLPKGYSPLRGVMRVFLLFFILLSAVMRSNFDTIHIHEHLPTFFLFIPLLKIRRKKICWTLHDVELYRTDSGMTGRLQLLYLKIVSQPTIVGRFADRIFVHAYSLREHLITKGFEKNKIEVIRHFDYRFLQEHEEKNIKNIEHINSINYVLFFGSIAPWKGIETLIDAAKIVRNKLGEKFYLIIAGTPYEGYKNVPFFQKLTQDDYKCINIIDKYISSSEIPSLIKNSAFLVLPYNSSSRFSVSGVIPLAYTFAKPVIVSSVSSLSEYVEDGKTGLIFDTNNSGKLADRVIELVEDKSKCMEMGNNAYKKITTEMSLEKCSTQINDIYNDIKK